MSSPTKLAKSALRSRIKAEVARLSAEERARQSAAVTSRLLQLPQLLSSRRVSIYLSMPDEVQTQAVVRHLLDSGRQCFIPRYEVGSSHMDMLRLASLADLESLPLTKWNIRQPAAADGREEALAEGGGGLDLVLVPGLAFTAAGDRLGRGRGYYDRYLHRCRQLQTTPPVTVALAFKQQLVDQLPVEETDVPVDLVLWDDAEP